jgi:hypothetical protein
MTRFSLHTELSIPAIKTQGQGMVCNWDYKTITGLNDIMMY